MEGNEETEHMTSSSDENNSTNECISSDETAASIESKSDETDKSNSSEESETEGQNELAKVGSKRGPYKQYELDRCLPIPESSLRSRNKKIKLSEVCI